MFVHSMGSTFCFSDMSKGCSHGFLPKIWINWGSKWATENWIVKDKVKVELHMELSHHHKLDIKFMWKLCQNSSFVKTWQKRIWMYSSLKTFMSQVLNNWLPCKSHGKDMRTNKYQPSFSNNQKAHKNNFQSSGKPFPIPIYCI